VKETLRETVDENVDRSNQLPKQDFDGMVAELWHTLNVCLYHTAYVKVYANTGANRLLGSERTQVAVESLSQGEREMVQEDALVFRAHFSSALWQLFHLVELLGTAYKRCKQEGIITPERYDELVKALEDDPTLTEIRDFRNMSHQFAGVFVALHDSTGAFIAHVLPPLDAQSPVKRAQLNDAEIQKLVKNWELNMKLEAYCNRLGEYCEGLFRVIDAKYKAEIPRSHGFMITVPYSYKDQALQQQAIHITARRDKPKL